MNPPAWRASGDGVRVDVRVMPRAPRDRIEAVRNGRLVVRVTAPPVDGAANDAVVALFAATLRVPRARIQVVAGATTRNKVVAIAGLDVATLDAILSAILA
jgi:uncharacterized protein